MKTFYLLTFFVFCLVACKTTESVVVKNTQKDVTTLALSGITNATSVFDQATSTYTFTVPIGTNIKVLALTFSIPTGAKSSPASGSTQDFTNPVTYTITAEDGTSAKYTIKINVQTASKSSTKQILAFSFSEQNPVVQATINNATFEVTATIPTTANIKSLKPTITVSDKSTISPLSGVSQDFTSPVKYIVTAEDGTMQVFTVKVQSIVPQSGGPGVYIAGYSVTNSISTTAVYWKNGELIRLTENPELHGIATSIVANDKDVYVAGSEKNATTNNFDAKYWKNGISVSLTDGKYLSWANSIFIAGNDVYVAGKDRIAATYWKNNIPVVLTDGKRSADAKSILVNGNDVYVAGYDGSISSLIGGSRDIAKYWKNGVAISLTDGKYNAQATSIILNGNDVYVGGYEEDSFGNEIGKYWKNGVAVNLNMIEGNIHYHSKVNSIAFVKDELWAVGYEPSYSGNSKAVVWRGNHGGYGLNPNIYNMENIDDEVNYASSIFINGEKVYVSGGGYYPYYWENNDSKKLESINSMRTTSIFVK